MQLYAGTKIGIKAAVHVVNEMFEEHEAKGWGVLVVDVKNALNPLSGLLHYGMY